MNRRDALTWMSSAAAAGALSPTANALNPTSNVLTPDLVAQAPSDPSDLLDWAARIAALSGPAPGEIVINAVGDMIISDPAGGRKGAAVEQMYRVLREGDASFGNCEQPVATTGTLYQKPSQMAWPPILDDFWAVGLNMLNVANNHYMDLGPDALEEGIEESKKRGFVVAGAGRNLVEAATVGIRMVKGVRVGLLGFWVNQGTQDGYADYARVGRDKPGVLIIQGVQVARPSAHGGVEAVVLPDASDMRVMSEAIKAARTQVDFLMVSFHQHWSGSAATSGLLEVAPKGLYERTHHATPRNRPPLAATHPITPADLSSQNNQVAEGRRIICRAAIDAGADVVIGHGPHVLNGVEVYRGKPIIYSLGHYYMQITRNGRALPQFEFNPTMVWSVETNWFLEEHRWTAIARMFVRGGRVTRLQLLPLYMDVQRDGLPYLPTDPESTKINSAIATLSRPFETHMHTHGWYSEIAGLTTTED
jgi:poly-gamma-glutamate synthesis protein (capsule biosynthesis protein)